ncbi:hypothetical protein, partial [Thermogutta sp.]|uniref:hypothetical protein n=1 Tax=Thermogutta sp. TaxID=1962930 RepID=UPI0025F97C56
WELLNHVIVGAIHELPRPAGPCGLNPDPTPARVDVLGPIGEEKVGMCQGRWPLTGSRSPVKRKKMRRIH